MQGIAEKTVDDFLKLSVDIVKNGVEESQNSFILDPEQFEYRTAKSIYINSCIKKHFQRCFIKNRSLMNRIRHLKSYGVDYYVIDGKAIICFKKMDRKSRVSGFYSNRFKNLMDGNAIKYSKAMMNNLAEMGVHKSLPIYFVGHVLDSIGRLEDVRLVHYNQSKVAYELSLLELFKPNLFTVKSEEEYEVLVTSKLKKYGDKLG
ncbi:MAG: hypothetical protein DWP94_03430 [Flavobacterium sp.]|nr:MAG: hypothetical protein DWP94_03430 [Flavobacterium sp.]